MIAKSLRDAATHTSAVRQLVLRKSEDLLCMNLMCERVGEACVCKLSVVLERLPQLEHLDVSRNNLKSLPPAIFSLRHLTSLNVSGNKLSSLPDGLLSNLASLEALYVEDNPDLTALPADAVLPALTHVYARGTSPTFTLPPSLAHAVLMRDKK
ncbi:hypothetical protein SDRG_05498 [Saprolegnia diclina VS20]|uniref:Uncharacterized protein n=1 Tax=Saprolegnia diclina (strain VS20) TaxID=1156394 RepID=T0QH27_SAPDV|nr:hypothetical protein SDRG_05498 [Saprolegnia diclina VS20]EQC37274.1 hypothetical protein SDRG_05498 [Saprolegnia diclina VS20]|eukprot:XP_008609436.1 hypothetical protein SDRG_05498 [Saprolegnia diclina VS20]